LPPYGIDENTIEQFFSAPMHVFGKIAVPNQYCETCILDPAEWKIMKCSSVIGAKILQGSDAEFN